MIVSPYLLKTPLWPPAEQRMKPKRLFLTLKALQDDPTISAALITLSSGLNRSLTPGGWAKSAHVSGPLYLLHWCTLGSSPCALWTALPFKAHSMVPYPPSQLWAPRRASYHLSLGRESRAKVIFYSAQTEDSENIMPALGTVWPHWGQREWRKENTGCDHLYPPDATSWEVPFAFALEKIGFVVWETTSFMLT